MRAGKLKDEIKFYKEGAVIETGPGNTETNMIPFWSTYAEIKPLKATRTIETFVSELLPVYSIKCRYRRDMIIDETIKIEFMGAMHSIREISEDQKQWDIVVIRDGD